MTTLTGREATARPLTTRSHRNRAARTTGRIAWKTTRWLVRKGWQHRTALAPLYATITAYVLAVVEYMLGGYGTITLAAAAVGGLTIARMRGLPVPAKLAEADPHDRYLTIGLWVSLALITVLGVVTANAGSGVPMPGIWALTAVAVTAAWWTHLATRPTDTTATTTDRIRKTWVSKVSTQKGALPGSTLGKIKRVDGTALMPDGHLGPIVERTGWIAKAELASGSSADAVLTAANAAKLAAAYRTSRTNVIMSRDDHQSEHHINVAVMSKTANAGIVEYEPEAWQKYQDGCVPIAVCADGTVAQYRIDEPGSGASHALITGVTRSGKSRGVTTIITQAAATGLVVPIVADPQGGASLPEWAGHRGVAPVIARNPEEIASLFDRLDVLRQQRENLINSLGLGEWDATTMMREHGLPIYMAILDEAHMIMGDPDAVHHIEIAAKTWSKLGMSIALLTQSPNLTELGGSNPMRENIKAGNVLCFRSEARTTGGMMVKSWSPDPYDIPAVIGKQHTKGMCVIATSAPFGSPSGFARFPLLDRNLASSEAIRLARDVIPDPDSEAARILGIDVPAWRKRVDDIADGTAEPDSQPSALVEQGRATAKNRILDYLRDTEASAIETAQIVADLQLKPSTVSTTLKRLAEDGHVESPGHGLWKAK